MFVLLMPWRMPAVACTHISGSQTGEADYNTLCMGISCVQVTKSSHAEAAVRFGCAVPGSVCHWQSQ